MTVEEQQLAIREAQREARLRLPRCARSWCRALMLEWKDEMLLCPFCGWTQPITTEAK